MKRTRLKPQSTSRRLETMERQQCVELVLARDGWVCQALRHFHDTPCEGMLTSHEVVQRSVRPGSHLEPELQVTVCHRHHMLLHDQVGYSHRVGLLRKSWEVDDDGHLLPQTGDAA